VSFGLLMLIKKIKNSESDPFVRLEVEGLAKQTKWLKDEKNPIWNETFEFGIEDATREYLYLQMFDHDKWSNDPIGSKFSIPVINVCKNNGIIDNLTIPIPDSIATTLLLSLKYHEKT